MKVSGWHYRLCQPVRKHFLLLQFDRPCFGDGAILLSLCRFSDAGVDEASTCSGGRRLKSAKARNRGKWGTVGAAGSMGI